MNRINDQYHISHIFTWAEGCYMASVLSEDIVPCEAAWRFWRFGLHDAEKDITLSLS